MGTGGLEGLRGEAELHDRRPQRRRLRDRAPVRPGLRPRCADSARSPAFAPTRRQELCRQASSTQLGHDGRVAVGQHHPDRGQPGTPQLLLAPGPLRDRGADVLVGEQDPQVLVVGQRREDPPRCPERREAVVVALARALERQGEARASSGVMPATLPRRHDRVETCVRADSAGFKRAFAPTRRGSTGVRAEKNSAGVGASAGRGEHDRRPRGYVDPAAVDSDPGVPREHDGAVGVAGPGCRRRGSPARGARRGASAAAGRPRPRRRRRGPRSRRSGCARRSADQVAVPGQQPGVRLPRPARTSPAASARNVSGSCGSGTSLCVPAVRRRTRAPRPSRRRPRDARGPCGR